MWIERPLTLAEAIERGLHPAGEFTPQQLAALTDIVVREETKPKSKR